MQKVVFQYIVLLLVAAGCATTAKTSVNTTGVEHGSVDEILRDAAGKNITRTGFFIQKGKITTVSENNRISLYFTMKYNSDGRYLISLRSKTGMEAFRIFISNDTVLVNDRLNKNVLYGTTADFTRISGIPASLLKISVGDIFINKPVSADDGSCLNNELKINDWLAGLMVNSTVDCRESKLKSIIVSAGEREKFIRLEYFKYRDDMYSVPRKVEVNDALRSIKIVISINKYLAPWFGEIEFIPGAGYKIKPII